jgi:hypothetical protein
VYTSIIFVYLTDVNARLSQAMLDVGEYIGSLLAVWVSLRLFAFEVNGQCPMERVLAFVTKAFDRVHHLDYFAMWHNKYHYLKRIGGGWVICDETEFPSLVL